MKIFYSRISSVGQNPERQEQDVDNFDKVLTDTCSGAIELFKRPKGSQLLKLIQANKLDHLEIHSIDRLGRNTIDVLKTWKLLTDKNVKVVCRNPNLSNFKSGGKQDEVSEMIITILSTMAKFERSMIKERQMEGIQIAKAKGKYGGRKIGTVETVDNFLKKDKSKQIIMYLNKGYPYKEISEIMSCSFSTISKVNSYYHDQEMDSNQN